MGVAPVSRQLLAHRVSRPHVYVDKPKLTNSISPALSLDSSQRFLFASRIRIIPPFVDEERGSKGLSVLCPPLGWSGHWADLLSSLLARGPPPPLPVGPTAPGAWVGAHGQVKGVRGSGPASGSLHIGSRE